MGFMEGFSWYLNWFVCVSLFLWGFAIEFCDKDVFFVGVLVVVFLLYLFFVDVEFVIFIAKFFFFSYLWVFLLCFHVIFDQIFIKKCVLGDYFIYVVFLIFRFNFSWLGFACFYQRSFLEMLLVAQILLTVHCCHFVLLLAILFILSRSLWLMVCFLESYLTQKQLICCKSYHWILQRRARPKMHRRLARRYVFCSY